MKETQFRKNGKNDGRAGEKDTQKKQKSKAFKKEKTKENLLSPYYCTKTLQMQSTNIN